MSFKITLESESLLTHWIRTNKLLLPLVMLYVEIKLRLAGEALVTASDWTLERLIFDMRQHMIFEMALCEKRLPATILGASVHPVSL